MADTHPPMWTSAGISCQSFYGGRATQTSSAAKNKAAHRIVQEIPSSSSDEYSDNSEDEWLPEKNRDIGAEDDGDADNQDAESEDDDEGQDAEEGQHDQGAEEECYMEPDHAQACNYVWKVQDNDFEGDFPPFLGDWELIVEGSDPIDFITFKQQT